ncbi:MAG: hypothetical protein LBQ35_07025 [Spirochaetaceae bacterium]|nr:hypothetical protein [Spirochaetaceae bacterium]
MRVCLLGAAISLALLGVLIFALAQPRPSGPGRAPEAASFSQLLRAYDNAEAGGAAAETLDSLLDRLEQNALGVESHLSVLKRRRILAAAGGRFLAAYRDSAERAAAKFPHSELPAAAAAEAALLSGATEEAALRAGTFEDPALLPLAFAASVLAGDYGSPETALARPRSGEYLSLVSEFGVGNLPGASFRNWKAFTLDAAALRVLAGDAAGAAPLVQVLASGPPETAGAAWRFAAEYHYDFGSLRRAAELFTRQNGDEALARGAEALALAGDWGAARNLWTLLASPDSEGLVRTGGETLERSLYNLAASAESAESEKAWLERLLEAAPDHLYGLIRYSRLLPAERALAMLGARAGEGPLPGLEGLRRQRELWPVERVIPETWLLINRFPGSEPLCRWAAWYFDFQREYAESARLRRRLDAPWAALHEALALIRAGDYAGGEALLRDLEGSGPWQVPANLGRLMEARRAPSAALEYYGRALDSAAGDAEKARLLYRVSRCLRALGRTGEARRALEEGLALDGDNLAIRTELGHGQ